MRQTFKKCMRHLWPNGVSDSQLTDLARVFAMGFVEGLDNVNCQPQETDLAVITDMLPVSWIADASWRWW